MLLFKVDKYLEKPGSRKTQSSVTCEVIVTGKFKAPGSREVIEKDGETTAFIVEKIIIR